MTSRLAEEEGSTIGSPPPNVGEPLVQDKGHDENERKSDSVKTKKKRPDMQLYVLKRRSDPSMVMSKDDTRTPPKQETTTGNRQNETISKTSDVSTGNEKLKTPVRELYRKDRAPSVSAKSEGSVGKTYARDSPTVTQSKIIDNKDVCESGSNIHKNAGKTEVKSSVKIKVTSTCQTPPLNMKDNGPPISKNDPLRSNFKAVVDSPTKDSSVDSLPKFTKSFDDCRDSGEVNINDRFQRRRVLDWGAEVDNMEKAAKLEADRRLRGNSTTLPKASRARVKPDKKEKRETLKTSDGNIRRSTSESDQNRPSVTRSVSSASISEPKKIDDNETFYNRADLDDGPIDKRHPDELERPLCVVNPESHVTEGFRPRMNLQPNHIGHSVPYPVQHQPGLGRPRFQPPIDQFNFYHRQSPPSIQSWHPGFPIPFPIEPTAHFQHQPVMADHYQTSRRLTSTEKNIHEAMQLDQELGALLKQPFYLIDTRKMSQIRFKVQLRYEATILSDIHFCSKHNVEQLLWKAAFYQVIEWYRPQLAAESGSDKEIIRRGYISLLEEGNVFYENLLAKLQEAYSFSISDFCDCEALRPRSLARIVKLAVMSSQKIIICLGDLARYLEMINDGINFGKARSWYCKAQTLAPTNGRPYNQLAVLAVFNRRKFDAVFYYMRSLAASNPFQTAKEGLISIFHDVRKKYEETYKDNVVQRNEPKTRKSINRRRVEIWYTPDGEVVKESGHVNQDNQESDVDDDDDRNLSDIVLNKMFTLSFLHVHGKLFCHIGFETFNEVCKKMARQFKLLLHLYPGMLSCHRLLQIVTINMFAIDNAKLKSSDGVAGSTCESSWMRYALDVSIEMFRLALDRCNQVLADRVADDYVGPIITEEIQQILPAIKIWCEWLMYQRNVWNPLPSLTDFGLGANKRNVWTEMATFLNMIPAVRPECVLVKEMSDGYVNVVLPENHMLSGFVPRLGIPEEYVYATANIDKDTARNCYRLDTILLCGEVLLGITPPLLKWNVLDKGFCPVTTNRTNDPGVECSPQHPQQEQPKHDFFETYNEHRDNLLPDDVTSCNQMLRTMKLNLEREKAKQDRQALQSKAVLHEASQSPMLYSKVCPRWLVLDTNCFIHYLPKIQSLVASKKFHLAIPLIVVDELEGLSSGQPRRTTCELSSADVRRVEKVGEEAGRAFRYLVERGSMRDSQVHALTSKGSLLDTFTFRGESSDDEKSENNDDIILKCCLQLAKQNRVNDKQTKIVEKGDEVHLYWDVVLLTDDRHLRIKALASDFPVVPLPTFIKRMNVM